MLSIRCFPQVLRILEIPDCSRMPYTKMNLQGCYKGAYGFVVI